MATATQINKLGSMTSDPIRNFRFLVTFYPVQIGSQTSTGWTPSTTLGFTSVSGLNITTESIPYRQGDYNTSVHQVPGQTTFNPITLQRGVLLGSSQHWDWMKMLFQVKQDANQRYSADKSFRADVEIAVLNHPVPYADQSTGFGGTGGTADASRDDLVAARFRVYNAWPTSVAYSDLNAGDNALLVEQMTLVHEGFDVKWASVSNDTITGAGTF